MGMIQDQHPFSLPAPPLPSIPPPSSSSPEDPMPPSFDASRMIGIIRRKALIKDLAAMYHAECLSHCQQLLEFQKRTDEPFTDNKIPEETKRDTLRPSKRVKKTR